MWTRVVAALWLALGCGAWDARAQGRVSEQLITSAHYPGGEVVPYLLTEQGPAHPRYVVVLMPGGSGRLEPEMREGKVVFKGRGNFLIRSRALFTDADMVAIATDSTGSPERMGAITDDVARRFPGARVYVIGTSRSTLSTMQLADRMDGKVAGFVHTSSMSGIARFDTRSLKSRQLIVHHKNDGCYVTGYGTALYNHEQFGTAFIAVEGGVSQGDPCEALAYHGYNGIEKEVIGKIKAWIRQD
ncbi:MAG: hypothetical protein KGL73_02400 [Burkholderiales bacterium]|nr:hypothetical protein [Burkholderiales bacterium]